MHTSDVLFSALSFATLAHAVPILGSGGTLHLPSIDLNFTGGSIPIPKLHLPFFKTAEDTNSGVNVTADLNLTALSDHGLPIPRILENGILDIPQTHSKPVLPNGPRAMAAAHARYGVNNGTVPTHVRRAVTRSINTVVQASPEAYDVEFLTEVTVGGQKVMLNFDTGSADLWVFSSLQSSSQIGSHSIYDISKSSNAKLVSGQTWTITYGDGSGATGVVYSDKVAIGSATVTSQAVEAATSVSSSFVSDSLCDGLVGLGFGSVNTVRPTQQTTWFDNIKASLASPIFAVNLKKNAVGGYRFGATDSTKYSGSITYTPVDSSSGYWKFSTTAFAVGTTKTSHASTMIADTGTTLILMDDTMVKAYYAKITGAYYDSSYAAYLFPCSSTKQDFALYTNGYKIKVPASYMSYAQVSNTYCYGSLQSSSGLSVNIFGSMGLKSQYVVFSKAGSSPTLGFAAKA